MDKKKTAPRGRGAADERITKQNRFVFELLVSVAVSLFATLATLKVLGII